MRGPIVAAATVAAAVVPGWAAATPQPVTTDHVAEGKTAVASCGTLTGVTVSWTNRAGVVTQVVLGSIPSACVGGSLALTFTGATNSSLGTAGPATVGGASLSLTVSGSPTASAITGTQLAVVGP